MASDDSGRLGFVTSASQQQERFDAIFEALRAKQVDWAGTRSVMKASADGTAQTLGNAMKLPTPDLALVASLSGWLAAELGAALVCRLGEELAETHKRLAGVEKAVETLLKTRR